MTSQTRKAERFRALHVPYHGFVMPNAWDAGSAILLAESGFPAIASSSAGIAFSLGRPDYDSRNARLAVGRDEMLARIREIVEAVPLPVNGDLEAGYGDAPEAVAETVRLAIEAGLAGGNIEDKLPGADALYDEGLAVERIRAARAAIDAAGSAFVLTARTDALLLSSGDGLKAALRRAGLYREAGADCVYAPGASDLEAIRALVQETGAPVNVVLGLTGGALDVPTLLQAGVARISLGGSIARAALGFVRRTMAELRDRGSIGFAAGQIPQGELNVLFARAREQSNG